LHRQRHLSNNRTMIVPGVGILFSGCIPSSTADAGSTKTPAATIQFHRRIQSHPSLPTTHTIPRRRQYCILPLRRCNPERPLPLLRKQFLRQIQSHRFLPTTHTIPRRRITSSRHGGRPLYLRLHPSYCCSRQSLDPDETM